MRKESARYAAAYLRVSTEEQAELSPRSQLAEIQKYALQEGLTLLPDHIYLDAGCSGKKARGRPAFLRMIAAAKEKNCPFSVILLWKYSRFARNQEESIFYKSILRSKCRIDVISVTEPLLSGPFGSLMERMIEWMDEFYSIRLGQEVRRSMQVNAQQGKLQTNPSFGYRAQNGCLVPLEEEAVHVRWMFDACLAGKSLFAIAKELNAMGVRTHRGNPFENRTVEYILRNPVYIGKLRWNPVEKTRRDFSNANIILADSSHAPLVDVAVWEAVQQRLDVKHASPHPCLERRSLPGWISGLVRCAACGATLVFAKPHFYKCNNYVRGRCTFSQHVRSDLLETAILSRLETDSLSSLPLAWQWNACCPCKNPKLACLEARMQQLQSQKKRLQEAYLTGVLNLPDFSAAKQELEKALQIVASAFQEAQAASQIEGLSKKRQNIQKMLPDILAHPIFSALRALPPETFPLEAKHHAAQAVLETCFYDKSQQVLSITYQISL